MFTFWFFWKTLTSINIWRGRSCLSVSSLFCQDKCWFFRIRDKISHNIFYIKILGDKFSQNIFDKKKYKKTWIQSFTEYLLFKKNLETKFHRISSFKKNVHRITKFHQGFSAIPISSLLLSFKSPGVFLRCLSVNFLIFRADLTFSALVHGSSALFIFSKVFSGNSVIALNTYQSKLKEIVFHWNGKKNHFPFLSHFLDACNFRDRYLTFSNDAIEAQVCFSRLT